MSNRDETLPAEVVRDLESAPTREHFDAALKSAYAAGWSLQKIADAVGVSHEAIRLRLRRSVPADMLRTYSSPRPSNTAKELRTRKVRNHRILGLKRNSPVMHIPAAELNRLAELHELVTTCRGWTPLDAPARAAIPEFGALLDRLITKYSIPQGHLERVMGMGRISLTVWRRNHGYLPQMPSQRSYKGVLLDLSGGGRPRTLFVGGKCRNGHVLTTETLAEYTIARNGTTLRQCRVCERERKNAKYAAAADRRSA